MPPEGTQPIMLPGARKAPPSSATFPVAKSVNDILIQGSVMNEHISAALVDASVVISIEEAMTLRFILADPTRQFLLSGIFGRRVKATLDNLLFELVQMKKSGDQLTIVFEDAWVAEMRRRKSFRKAIRGQVTRAGFVKLLTQEISGLEFFCPDPSAQEIAVPASGVKPVSTPDTTAQVISDIFTPTLPTPRSPKNAQTKTVGASMFGGPTDSTVSQTSPTGYRGDLLLGKQCFAELSNDPQNGASADFAALGGLPYKAKLEITYKGRTIVAEKLDVGAGGGSVGTEPRRLDIWFETAAYLGFSGLGLVQIRRIPDGSSVGPVSGASSPTAVNVPGTYEFTRGFTKRNSGMGQKEDTWACADRLAREVQWRRYMIGNTLWFAADKDLINQPPKATINERSPGVISIDFDWDAGKVVADMTIQVVLKRWSLLPGAVINVTDVGPASGKWLISSLEYSLYSTMGELKLTRPQPALLEPPTPVKSSSSATDTTIPYQADTANPYHDFSYLKLIQLLQQYLKDGRLIVSHPNDRNAILDGTGIEHSEPPQDTNHTVAIGKPVYQFLAFMLKNNLCKTMRASCILGSHNQMTAGGNPSQHWIGLGLDLGDIDGKPGTFGNWDPSYQREKMIIIGDQTKLHPELGVRQIIGHTSLSGPVGSPSTAEYLDLPDHADHIHVGF